MDPPIKVVSNGLRLKAYYGPYAMCPFYVAYQLAFLSQVASPEVPPRPIFFLESLLAPQQGFPGRWLPLFPLSLITPVPARGQA